jgi:hypothetical protein
MYTYLRYIKKSGLLLTSLCVGYLKVTTVQNDHHQYRFIVDNCVEEMVILLVVLLVEWQHRKCQFRASRPAQFSRVPHS